MMHEEMSQKDELQWHAGGYFPSGDCQRLLKRDSSKTAEPLGGSDKRIDPSDPLRFPVASNHAWRLSAVCKLFLINTVRFFHS
jgi:hypothetical protein